MREDNLKPSLLGINPNNKENTPIETPNEA